VLKLGGTATILGGQAGLEELPASRHWSLACHDCEAAPASSPPPAPPSPGLAVATTVAGGTSCSAQGKSSKLTNAISSGMRQFAFARARRVPLRANMPVLL